MTNGPAEDEDNDDGGDEEAEDASRVRAPSAYCDFGIDIGQRASVAEVKNEHKPETEAPKELPLRNGDHAKTKADSGDDVNERLDAAERERDSLRAEVTELRKSLEGIQSKHEEEVTSLREEKEEVEAAKEKADSQYQTLLGRVNTIRSQLGERLKADAVRTTCGLKE